MIDTIRQLRRATSQALADVLQDNLESNISELELRDAFHTQLSKLDNVTAEGWYMPPPHGVIVAIGNPPSFDRVNQQSFRPEATWPSADEHLTPESLLYAYGSRAHTTTGLIGDIAGSFYVGGSPAIHAHLRKVWDVTLRIAQATAVGMTLAELSQIARKLIAQAGFENNVLSVHDDSTSNIGHTIPWCNEPISDADRQTLESGAPDDVAELISGKRRFITDTESLEIKNGVAFTIEPRLSAPGLPMASYHIVVGFEGGIRKIVTEFEPLFDLFDMSMPGD